MKEFLTYADVLIEPKYSTVTSRSNVDTSSILHKTLLELPVITANMKTVTSGKMAVTACLNGGMGILHRFMSIEDNVAEFEYANNLIPKFKGVGNIGVSIGVHEEDKKRFEALYEAGARIFCIDVAHGHHILVKNMVQWINDNIFIWDRAGRGKMTLIVGNIATGDAYYDLTNWGADVVKVGIGPGHACQTRKRTGCGVPQLGALQDIHEQRMGQKSGPSIIADGGISHIGDVAKALKYADAVMMGSYFAGTTETPGHVHRNAEGGFYKVYGGSASAENKGENKFVEGITTTIPFIGHAEYLFKEIKEGLQSAFSYVGAYNIQEFKNNCEFVHVTGAGSTEGHY